MLDLDPGPYGAYIWLAFGLTAGVIAAMAVASLLRARRWRRRAEGWARAHPDVSAASDAAQ